MNPIVGKILIILITTMYLLRPHTKHMKLYINKKDSVEEIY